MADIPISKMVVPGSNDTLHFRDDSAAKKPQSQISGNLASLDASGNLTDAGWASDKTTTSASGNPISIPDLKTNQLAINPVITLEPIQAGSGDPSPSNVRAISGYDKIEILSCGKNLFTYDFLKSQTDSGITVTVNADKTISFVGTNNSGATKLFYCRDVALNILTGSYIVSGGVTAGQGIRVIFYYGQDGNTHSDINDTEMSFDFNATNIVNFVIAVEAGVAVNALVKPMIRDASIVDNTYVPYIKSTDIQLTLGQTIYGGTLDVEKGILTVDRGYKLITNTDDAAEAAHTTLGNYSVLIYSPHNTIVKSGTVICNKLSQVTDYDLYNTDITGIAINGYNALWFAVSGITTKEDMNTWLAATNLQVVYELATPYTIQLTPHEISLLKDYAYTSTNGTNMSFSYKNGEMASLGDVESLGKTVNLLGDVIDNKIQITENPVNPIQITIHLKNGNSLSFMSLFGYDLKYGTVVNNTWSGWKKITATD